MHEIPGATRVPGEEISSSRVLLTFDHHPSSSVREGVAASLMPAASTDIAGNSKAMAITIEPNACLLPPLVFIYGTTIVSPDRRM
jgi:hypothetical protein